MPAPRPITLHGRDGPPLSLAALFAIGRGARVVLSPRARARVARNWRQVEAAVDETLHVCRELRAVLQEAEAKALFQELDLLQRTWQHAGDAGGAPPRARPRGAGAAPARADAARLRARQAVLNWARDFLRDDTPDALDVKLRLVEASLYGVNTGFGQLKTNVVDTAGAARALQDNIVRSHACGVGEPLPDHLVRMMMALRLASLLRGYSGVRPETLARMAALLNADLLPVVPAQGSVGASGDLAPLAHMSLAVIGEGRLRWRRHGRRVAGESPPATAGPGGRVRRPSAAVRAAYRAAGLRDVHYRLHYKEGLALTNGTAAMTAIGAAALIEAEETLRAALIANAMSLEALRGRTRAYDAVVHATRPHPGQARAAQTVLALVGGPRLPRHTLLNTYPHVHDAYSLRCAPVVLGAALDAVGYVRRVLEIEANAVTDDPIHFAPEDLRGFPPPSDGLRGRLHYEQGNFHGEPVAMACDFLKIALAEVANIAERRIQHLLDEGHNRGLPACLISTALAPDTASAAGRFGRIRGANSGLLLAQYAAASLVSENKVLAHPASVDSIPTSANAEDHVSMGTIAARQALQIGRHAREVVAIELLCAAQAFDLRLLAARREGAPIAFGAGTRRAWRRLRATDAAPPGVLPLEEDRVLADDVARVRVLIESGALVDAVGRRRLELA